MNFYFDENLPPRISKALNELEGKDNNIYHTQLEFKKGVKDPDLYPLLKDNDGILITNDLKMLSRTAERSLIITYKISVVFIKFASGSNFVTKYQLIFKKWEEIKDELKNNKLPIMFIVKPVGKNQLLDYE